MGTIDLMECMSTLPITTISRDICARPNTFALETIRPGKAGETETLVLKRSLDRKNTMVERHMLSADTKEVLRVYSLVRARARFFFINFVYIHLPFCYVDPLSVFSVRHPFCP